MPAQRFRLSAAPSFTPSPPSYDDDRGQAEEGDKITKGTRSLSRYVSPTPLQLNRVAAAAAAPDDARKEAPAAAAAVLSARQRQRRVFDLLRRTVRVDPLRAREAAQLAQAMRARVANVACAAAVPALVTLAAFAAHTLWAGRPLSPAQAFVTVAIFNVARFPLGILPLASKNVSEAFIACARIQAPPPTHPTPAQRGLREGRGGRRRGTSPAPPPLLRDMRARKEMSAPTAAVARPRARAGPCARRAKGRAGFGPAP